MSGLDCSGGNYAYWVNPPRKEKSLNTEDN